MAKKIRPKEYVCKSTLFNHNNQNINYLAKIHPLSQHIKNHVHNFYETEIILSGNGTSTINGSTYPLSRGTVYIMRPSDIHNVIPDEGETLKICNISFKDAVVQDKLLNKILLNSGDNITCLDEAVFQKVISVFNILKDFSNEKNIKDESMASHAIALILELILSNMSDLKHDMQNNYIMRSLEYIQKHFLEDFSQEDIADFVGLSVPYFSSMFKNSVGCGYKEYLLNVRIAHARKLIKTTDIPVSDVGYECGFSSFSSFHRSFTRIVGTTPSKYAKEGQPQQK